MEKISIFVTVGTNHYNFVRMLKLVDECLTLIDTPHVLTLQQGFSELYKTYPEAICEKMFSREEAESLYENADIVFSHCGIGSIYNSLYYNRPTVIIPRLEKYEEFSDDHQLQIAQEIASNPLVHMIEESVDTKAFSLFVEQHLATEKVKKDLTNHKLAEFIKSRLYL